MSINNDKRNQLRNKLKKQQQQNINNKNIIHANNNSFKQWEDLSDAEQQIYIDANNGNKAAARTAYNTEQYAIIAINRKQQSVSSTPVETQQSTQEPNKPFDNTITYEPAEVPQQPTVTPPSEQSTNPPEQSTNPQPIETLPTVEKPFEEPTQNETPKPVEYKEPSRNDKESKGEDITEEERRQNKQSAAEFERRKKVKEKKEATEQAVANVRKRNEEQLKDAIRRENDAREKLNQDPTDKQAQKDLAKAIKDRQAAQEAVDYYNANSDDKQIVKDAMIAAGDLTQKRVSDPPGHVTENEEWIKSNRNKYKDVTKLDASQDNPAERKYINFKQDYVVLIRKKPFYASTAQQRYATADVYNTYHIKGGGEPGNKIDGVTEITEFREKIQEKGEPLKDRTGRVILPEDNYLRAYQINNFINISINTTVNAPGTCSVTMKGAERVICAENNQQSEFGFFSWSDLIGSWLNINEEGTVDDGTGINYTTGSGWGNEDVQQDNAKDKATGKVSNQDSSNRKTTYTSATRTTKASWKESTNQWRGVEQGLFDEGYVY